MARTNMPRHQTRIRNVIHTHSTTLIPLFDSAHWFLVEVNTDTRTFTFYNSSGRYGQQRWLPILKAWLIQHIHGPWTAVQGPAIQQPGATECGTHTLLNIMKHIPGAPSPDISSIQWSHNMRVHIINTITASDCNPDHSDTHKDSQEVELLQPNKKQQCTRRDRSNACVGKEDNTDELPTTTQKPPRPDTPPPPSHSHSPHNTTHNTGRTQRNQPSTKREA